MQPISPDQMMRLIRACGNVPALRHGPEVDEVFDPFVFEGDEFFLYYSGSIECWHVGRTVDPPSRRHLSPPSGRDDDDPPEVVAAHNAIAFMPAPKMPDEFEGPLFRPTFWHHDHQFSWVLLDGKEGWQLASVNNPDASRGILAGG